MTNNEKRIKELEKKVEELKIESDKLFDENTKLKKHLSDAENEILALRDDLIAPLEIPIDLLFDVLPENEAINTLSRLSTKLHGRISSRIEKLRNETGFLENNLEIFELNSKNISLGRNFKKN